MSLSAPIVQRIEYQASNLKIGVRFPLGAQLNTLAILARVFSCGRRNRTGKGETGRFLLWRKAHENPKVFMRGR